MRSLSLLLIGAVLGGLAGFLFAAGNGITLDGHDHATGHGPTAAGHDGHAGHAAHDQLLDLPDGPDRPTIAIDLQPDSVSGWNLNVRTTGFRFAPEHASAAHVPGEGHAHVYVDGVKLARLYGDWMHIASLPSGMHTLSVTLNANSHEALAVGGVPLRAETMVTVE